MQYSKKETEKTKLLSCYHPPIQPMWKFLILGSIMKLHNRCYHTWQINQCQEGDGNHWQDFVDDQDWNFIKILLMGGYKRVNYFPQKSVKKSQRWYDSSDFNWQTPLWKEFLFVLKLWEAIKFITMGCLVQVQKHRSFRCTGLSWILILQRKENKHLKIEQNSGMSLRLITYCSLYLLVKKDTLNLAFGYWLVEGGIDYVAMIKGALTYPTLLGVLHNFCYSFFFKSIEIHASDTSTRAQTIVFLSWKCKRMK